MLRGYAADTPPSTTDFWNAWRHDYEAGLEPDLPAGMRTAPIDHHLRIPSNLIWREGRYAHQGRAVDALLKELGGIVSIATGGGKTRTALIAATEMQDLEPRHMCVVVLVPSRPLVRQWTDDIREFGIDPIVLTGTGTQDRRAELERVAVAFATERPRTEVVLMSNALFAKADSAEREWLAGLPETIERVLIADEVHNLGTPSFISNPPDFFAPQSRPVSNPNPPVRPRRNRPALRLLRPVHRSSSSPLVTLSRRVASFPTTTTSTWSNSTRSRWTTTHISLRSLFELGSASTMTVSPSR